MSKTVKTMIIREYKNRLGEFNDAALISIRGVKGIQLTKVRGVLREKSIKITMLQNALARNSFKGTALEGFTKLLTGSSALVYGGNSVVEVAREIVGLLEKFPALELKGALLDGQLYEGKNGVKELSMFPTREEAVAQVVTLIVSPARKLVGQIQGPGSNIAGIVKAIETKLEKNEEIKKVG
jgi:large subunit ribosomal protein L10